MKITVTTVDSATAEFEVSAEVGNKMAAGMQGAVSLILSLCVDDSQRSQVGDREENG